ncbi:MAG: hypothetical protein NVS1B7_7610 [Candidatus Saccharimonadales bacterium]
MRLVSLSNNRFSGRYESIALTTIKVFASVLISELTGVLDVSMSLIPFVNRPYNKTIIATESAYPKALAITNLISNSFFVVMLIYKQKTNIKTPKYPVKFASCLI